MTKADEWRKQTEEGKFKAFSLMCKKVAELEKENTELKEKYFKNITDCDWCDTYCNSQLNKAKELLIEVTQKYKLRTSGEKFADYQLIEQAEQFLKEIEK